MPVRIEWRAMFRDRGNIIKGKKELSVSCCPCLYAEHGSELLCNNGVNIDVELHHESTVY